MECVPAVGSGQTNTLTPCCAMLCAGECVPWVRRQAAAAWPRPHLMLQARQPALAILWGSGRHAAPCTTPCTAATTQNFSSL